MFQDVLSVTLAFGVARAVVILLKDVSTIKRVKSYETMPELWRG